MAEVNIVPVKTDNGKLRRTETFAFLDDFEAEMERLWQRTWPFTFGRRPRPLRDLAQPFVTWAPRVDVYQKDNSIVVKAELPGLKKQDVQVEIEGDDLVIRGESKAESEVKEDDYYRSERNVGSFYRRMRLPAGVTAEQIQATLKDGVLEVVVPKAAEAKPEAKKVTVQ